MLRAIVARATQSAAKKAESGISRSIIQKYDDGEAGAIIVAILAPALGPIEAICRRSGGRSDPCSPG